MKQYQNDNPWAADQTTASKWRYATPAGMILPGITAKENMESGLFAAGQAATDILNRVSKIGGGISGDVIFARVMETSRVDYLCESPVEIMMLRALMAIDSEPGQVVFPKIFDVKSDKTFPESDIIIAPQYPIIRYRVDFMVFVRLKQKLGMIAVEVDGANFHDVRKDAVRDALIKSVGVYDVIRVSGTKVMRAPVQTASLVTRAVQDWRAIND